ncbi:MAG: anti-sigma factor [Acidobacteriia bacterium]|nr:anti-sigma factor [Terriglobia bacterium]
MQCQESNRILEAYLDGEIDLMRSVELEDHLATCADCRLNLEGQRALRNLLQNASLRASTPEGMKAAILSSLQPAPPEEKASSGEKTKAGTKTRRRWFALPVVRWAGAAAVACVVLAGALMFWSRGQAEQKLAEQVVDNHIRSLLASHLADVQSSDQHTVKPWFNGKLSFSPTVVDLAEKGFPLAGGRLDYMQGQEVAALVYRRRLHVINVFIYPDAEHAKPVLMQRRGYNLICWADGSMEYWVVSDLNISELQEFVATLRRMPS